MSLLALMKFVDLGLWFSVDMDVGERGNGRGQYVFHIYNSIPNLRLDLGSLFILN